jgi:hypothetical protein
MALNNEFTNFCDRWLEKAQGYEDSDLGECFDKFTTLYVVYNALYVETAAYLHRKAIKEGRDDYKLGGDRFPDLEAATDYVPKFLGSKNLMNSLESKPNTRQAVERLKSIMDEGYFNISLDPVWGKQQMEEDEELRKDLRSRSTDEKASTILKIIYKVRCNLFHGRKGLNPEQSELLIPLITILEGVIELLYRRLKNAPFIENPRPNLD